MDDTAVRDRIDKPVAQVERLTRGGGRAPTRLGTPAQVMQRKRVDRELIWRLMRFADEAETAASVAKFGPTNGPTAGETVAAESLGDPGE